MYSHVFGSVWISRLFAQHGVTILNDQICRKSKNRTNVQSQGKKSAARMLNAGKDGIQIRFSDKMRESAFKNKS